MTFPGLIVMPVTDVEASKQTYRALLGVAPYIEGPYYVGFRTDTGEIGLDPNAKASGTNGALAYWDVENLQVTIGQLTESGASLVREPTDVGGGLMIAVLEDPDGNPIGLRQTR